MDGEWLNTSSIAVDMISNVLALQRKRKPHLQSSKVGVLVSPDCHVCDNARAFLWPYCFTPTQKGKKQ